MTVYTSATANDLLYAAARHRAGSLAPDLSGNTSVDAAELQLFVLAHWVLMACGTRLPSQLRDQG
jgi:hypothetical protein